MLHAPAEYPHPGSDAFLAPGGDPLRIIQRRADGRLVVALTDARFPPERASGNRTVEAAEVHPAREAATAVAEAKGRSRETKDINLKPRRRGRGRG